MVMHELCHIQLNLSDLFFGGGIFYHVSEESNPVQLGVKIRTNATSLLCLSPQSDLLLSEGSLRQACPLGYVGFALVLRDRCFLNISLELCVNNTTMIIFIGLIPKGKLREGRKFPFFFFFCRKSEIER